MRQGDEAVRRALAVGQRDEVEFGLGRIASVDRSTVAAVDRRPWQVRPAARASRPARRTGTRRRVEVSTERWSPRRRAVGMGWPSRCTRRVGTGSGPPAPHRTRTASGRHRTGRPPEALWDDGPTHRPHSTEGEHRWPPSAEPRPPGPAPSPRDRGPSPPSRPAPSRPARDLGRPDRDARWQTSPEELVAAAHAVVLRDGPVRRASPGPARRRSGSTSPPRSPSTSSRRAGGSSRAR